eukprot:s570_g3.t1
MLTDSAPVQQTDIDRAPKIQNGGCCVKSIRVTSDAGVLCGCDDGFFQLLQLLAHLTVELYKRFFANAPSGQDFFKQSTTRLYFLADRVVEMTVEMYREPRKMVQEISGLGLRHVGWGIPPELFSPYCSGFSLSLIAKILVRAVTEGSTLVMRAINTNQEAALKKAIAIAPRGRRAMELLNISVGTQSISPLFWSIESGSLNSARAMLVDLLTIRADRDVYYYGCDAMFTRHPDLILRLCSDASTLLWTLFDGLVWRSRLVQNGQRRVNYYIKHLVQDVEGNFSPALKWLAHHKDPRLVCHGVVVTFAASRPEFEESLGKNIATFVCRCFLYLGSMSKLVFDHCKTFCGALKAGDYHWYWILPVPTYLHSTQQVGSLLLVLLLILMYVQEPVLWCIAFGDNGPTSIPLSSTCEEANDVRTSYAVCSCLAMMMYWALLMDFTLLSMRISAFVLVCGNVLADVGLFSLALLFLILAFATSISSLNHRLAEFDGVGPWLTGLLQMTLGMFPPSKYGDFRSEVAVLVAVSVFVAVISIFLVNLLVAQLNQSYRDIFEDMQGFARLTLQLQMSRKKWNKFLSHLRFEDPLEFNEGDVGMAGGIQVLEPANANMVTEARKLEPDEQNDESKFARLEKLIIRATKKPKDKGAKGKKTPSALDASDLGSDQASDFQRSDFYSYMGSSTTPDCFQQNKWFVFDHVFNMSMEQWATFKAMFPSPGNNRPVQPIRSHNIAKNSFQDGGEPKQFDFFLGRHEGRDRFFPGEFFILVPIVATLLLMTVIMLSIFKRDVIGGKSNMSTLAETIGNSMGYSQV